MDNRLESLELQGLKTFAVNTLLEFPGKITAIVGPNGSGKSNIADAIRWVLGEQSFSLLRAKRTEDMIFSGSQQRSRAGMASATITFNNEDGWLPIDYSQVAITRQAYRDGQNEYLLNGQRVRLKDISELLSQTGLSERTYTIIGQGLVDAALALKPDERRKLFEEAAGIGLYRSRKEEALRRLENTRKNLDRVLDIMTEIKPRLRSLERQAERYQEYQRVQADLQLLLREWYGYQWHQKQQDLRHIRKAYQDQETRLYDLRKKYAAAETKVEQTRVILHENRKELEKTHSDLSDHYRKLEQVTRELAIIDERQRSFELQKGNLEIDIVNLEEEIKELDSQAEALKAEMDQRQMDYRAAAGEAEEIQQKLLNVTQENEALEKQLGAVRKKRITMETEKVQLSARLEELGHRNASLEDERTKIVRAINVLEREIDENQQSLAELEQTQQEHQKKFDLQQSKINTVVEQLENFHHEQQLIEHQLNEADARKTKIQTQLALLKEAESALSGYSEGSKKLLEISRKGRLPKGIEPLSQHMIVEEKYERAISAALGELTDILVMPTASEDVIIQYLEAKENERVALIALAQDRPQNPDRPQTTEEGVIGYANELIEVDGPYRRLVDSLFSDILIVRDAKTAQKMQTNLSGPLKIVTLSGLVFQANGVLISGQSPSGKRIGRTRQQSELQSDLEQLESQINQITANKAEVAESIAAIRSEQTELTDEFHRIEHENNAIRRKLQDTQDALTRQTQQMTWHTDRLATLDEQIRSAQSLIQSGEGDLSEIADQINDIEAEEQGISESLKLIPLFEVRQELNQWQTHQMVTQKAMEAAQQRYHDHSNRMDAAQERLATYQTRFAELLHSLVTVKEQKEKLKQAVSEIQGTIATVEAEKIEPLSLTTEETEKSISALQKLESHSHQQVMIAERQYTQLQLELGRRQDQLDHLRERIEDDFGLVSFGDDQRFDGPAPLPFNENLIETLPRVQVIPESHENEIGRLKNQLRRIGAINPEAQQEYIEVKERHEFLTDQVADLEKASKDLNEVIHTLDEMMETDFLKTYKAVNQEFSTYFSRLFLGGEAKLVFSDNENPVEGGVDIEARLPGRRQQGLALLSGGERSLTAVALIFALLKVSPPPFCILDEVDAMLDESNVGRFVEVLRELSKNIQVVIITHNRNTVQAADVIYGVTMGRDSTSQMISLKLEDVGDAYFE